MAAHGSDVWIMDRSTPVLLHLDRSQSPARLTEYLLPLAFEPPGYGGSRRLHADSGGCWITCPAEIVRCDHSGSQEVTVRRVTEDGGGFTVVVDGQLFAITQPYPSLRIHDRYGPVRFDPDEYPFRELIDGKLVRVEDRETMTLAWGDRQQRWRPDQAKATKQTKWTHNDRSIICAPDGDEHVADYDSRSRGHVHWIRPDPDDDPANADLIDPITYPPTWQK